MLEEFNEWFPKVKAAGLVVASQQKDDGIWVMVSNGEWKPFNQALAEAIFL